MMKDLNKQFNRVVLCSKKNERDESFAAITFEERERVEY
jgi:hypothetical protein